MNIPHDECEVIPLLMVNLSTYKNLKQINLYDTFSEDSLDS